MTVEYAFNFLNFLARKNQTGTISPSDFGRAFNSAQRKLYNELLGPITIAPHVALGMNARIGERLKPFKRQDAAKAVSSQIATFPTDFHALTLMSDNATGKPIQYMEDTKLAGRLRDAIDPIADANPGCYTLTSTGWNIYPATITSITIGYYILPPDVVYGYTTVNDRPVYDATASVQPLWDDLSCEKILAAACSILGFSFEKQSLVQFAQTSKTEGA